MNMKNAILISLMVLVTSCSIDLDPNGVYEGDKITFNAEDVIGEADAVLTKVFEAEITYFNRMRSVDLEKANKVRKAVNAVRKKAAMTMRAAISANEIYKAMPNDDTAHAREKAFAILQKSVSEAVVWLVRLTKEE